MHNTDNFVSYFDMNQKYTNTNLRRPLVDQIHIHLLRVDKTTIDSQWRLQEMRSSHWRLYINFRDGAQLKVRDAWVDLLPRRIYFVPAWLTFSTQCVGAVEHFFMHFDVLGMPGTLIRDVFDQVFCLGADDELVGQGIDLSKWVDDGVQARLEGQLQAKGFLYQTMAKLVAQLSKDKQAQLLGYDLTVAPVLSALRFLDQNFRRSVRNEDLAKLCHVSVDHFIRRFRSCVGQTPNQYLLERRIQGAAQQLMFSEDSIEKVAADNGFGNRHYFSRVFGRLMGMPPAAYRSALQI